MTASQRLVEAIVNGVRRMVTASSIPELSPKEMLDLVRDPVMTYNLMLATERGELGVISRQTRDIDPRTASNEALERALADCHAWQVTYPETDDYPLVEWLEAVCNDELLSRSIAKFSGGAKPKFMTSA